jgi:hypothetical protein
LHVIFAMGTQFTNNMLCHRPELGHVGGLLLPTQHKPSPSHLVSPQQKEHQVVSLRQLETMRSWVARRSSEMLGTPILSSGFYRDALRQKNEVGITEIMANKLAVYRDADKSLARADWKKKKTLERWPFFVWRGGHCCRGDLVGRTTFCFFFFPSGVQKLRVCSL